MPALASHLASDSASDRAYQLGYQPALDGLRALCLLGVLAYHSGFAWMQGGYLGVSTFFTLSGFLVTTLLLRDSALRPFWARRLRRLLPASLATIALIGATGWLWLRADALERLGAELLATLFYVVNWRFVGAEHAYALLFSDPSAVQHFWSLAIEGQFYLLFPLLVRGSVRIGGQRLLAIVVLAGIAVSTALGVWLGADPAAQDRIYFGTDTRAAELLVGAVIALAWPRLRTLPDAGWNAAGFAALALLLAAFSQLALDTAWLYRGGLLAIGLLSATVIAACLRGGALSRLLARKPLVDLGRVSYGAYLFHWPIYLIVAPEDWHPLPLFAVRVGLTIALAGISYRYFEEPIRRARLLQTPHFGRSALAATAAIALGVLWLQPRTLDSLPTPRPFGDDTAVTRVAFVGDSTAYNLRLGYLPWSRSRPDVWLVRGYSKIGCGVLGAFLAERLRAEAGGEAKWHPLRDSVTAPRCASFFDDTAARIASEDPHVVIAVFGAWELKGTRYPFDGESHFLGEPALDAEADAALERFYEVATAGGAHIAWLTPPRFRPMKGWDIGELEVERLRQRLNELVLAWQQRHPDRIHVLLFDEFVEEFRGGPFDEQVRPDGSHFTVEAAEEIVRVWLGEQSLAVLRRAN